MQLYQSSQHFLILFPLAGILSLIKSVKTSCGSECLSKAQKGAKFLFSRFWFVSLKNIFMVFVFHFQIRNDDSSNVQDSYNLSLNLLLWPSRLQSRQTITPSGSNETIYKRAPWMRVYAFHLYKNSAPYIVCLHPSSDPDFCSYISHHRSSYD